MEEYFSVSTVSKNSGASVKQIRDWTKKEYIGEVYQLIMDGRTMTFYTQKNIDIATKIYQLINNGYNLTGAVLKVRNN